MTTKETEIITYLFKINFIEPIKGRGDFETDNAIEFAKSFLRLFPEISEKLSEVVVGDNGNAGAEFLDELGISL